MESNNTSEASEQGEAIAKYSKFIFEIRRRLIITVSIFIIATISGFFYYEKIIRLLIDILSLKGVNIVFTSPFQFINLAISCGIASGIIFVFPVVTYQVLSFLKPALRSKEYKMILRFLPFSIILFVSGFIFGVVIMKWQIQISLANSVALGIGNVLDISKLIGTVLLVSVLMGIAFQFPIILLLLLRIGILSRGLLARNRFWVYLGSFIFAVLLPADSIPADILLTLPLVMLFELTLLFDRLMSRR